MALISPIELASGKQAYFVGKPNPLMITNVVYQIESKITSTDNLKVLNSGESFQPLGIK
jgi:ribonucleotide monophosphatase NagD (HAD superfamily)